MEGRLVKISIATHKLLKIEAAKKEITLYETIETILKKCLGENKNVDD